MQAGFLDLNQPTEEVKKIYKYINVHIHQWGMEIELNRPEKLNSLTTEMVHELYDVLQIVSIKPDSIILLTGSGTSFCTGQDVKESPPSNPVELSEYVNKMQRITELIVSYPYPVVAKVQGYALGAGCELALNADLIYATEDAVFGFPELKVGLSITQGSSYLLPRLIGIPKAKEWIYFSKIIQAKEMFDLHVVNELFTEENIDQEVDRRLNDLYKIDKDSLGSIKKLFHFGLEHSMQEVLVKEQREIKRLLLNIQEGEKHV